MLSTRPLTLTQLQQYLFAWNRGTIWGTSLFSLRSHVQLCERRWAWFSFEAACLGQSGSVRTNGFRVPPASLLVTELARGRMGPLQGHTAGSNNTYSTGQTVSQNNFIVPKIGVESTAETWKEGVGGQLEGREKEGGCNERKKEREGEGSVGNQDWKRGSPRESAVLGMNRVRQCEFISVRRIPIDAARGAGCQKQGSGLNKMY